jgi:GDPmannose 4,6-dehydratase
VKKRALVTGITGQDGSYLAEFLLEREYEVHGIVRRSSTINTWRINHLYQDPHEKSRRLILHYGDLTDTPSLTTILQNVRPEEVYNLGAQSHVKVSFETPEQTANSDALGTLRLLEMIHLLGMGRTTRFYQASTSELYGGTERIVQNETTPFNPRSPYAVAKQYGFAITKMYRQAYGMFACNGILFNHESPRRGQTFVTRKISIGLAKVKLDKQKKLFLGNLDAQRDWGFAPDYVDAMWRMLQRPNPEDFVIATGETHSVREFVVETGNTLGMDIAWEGKGVEERGVDRRSGKTIVEIDPAYFRPLEVDFLCGDSSKARKEIGWKPKITFKELVRVMAEADFQRVKNDEILY